MMEATTVAQPPRWYWVVAGVAALWMLIGVGAWVADLMTDEQTAAGFTDAQRQLYLSRPAWLFAVYAVAVFAGLAGAVGLLLRRSWATAVLAVSLAAIVVQFGYTFLVLPALELLGASALGFPLTVFLIGAALLWFAARSRARGWLRG
jgi:hypothetical protein